MGLGISCPNDLTLLPGVTQPLPDLPFTVSITPLECWLLGLRGSREVTLLSKGEEDGFWTQFKLKLKNEGTGGEKRRGEGQAGRVPLFLWLP